MKVKDLRAEAQTFYKDLKKSIKNDSTELSSKDNAAIMMIARTYHFYLTAVDDINTRGLIVTYINGNDKETTSTNPYYPVMKDLQVQLLNLFKEFGLTSKSKRYIKIDDQGNDVYTNMMSDLNTEKR